MQKSFLLARANMRKARGQTVTVAVLIVIASMLLNIWLMLALDYANNFDRRAAELNAEDAVLVFENDDDAFSGFLASAVAADARTDRYTLEKVLAFNGSSGYGGGQMSTYYVGMEKDTALKREIGNFRMLEEDKSITQNAVYVSYLYKTGGGFRLGDTFALTVANSTVRLKIAGFYENMMTGSFNGGICALLFDSETYTKIDETRGFNRAVMASVRLSDSADGEKFAGKVVSTVTGQYPTVQYVTNHYGMVKQMRAVTASICSVIVSFVALLTVLIALVVLASNISVYIGQNMKDLGALKAIGYTGKQLIGALLTQFLCIGSAGIVLGIGLSYAVFPAFSAMLIAQTGIPYAMRFLFGPLLITAAAVLTTVAATVWLSSGRIRKIEPIAALRQGLKTHSFKKNRMPLDTARAPLSFSLAMKTTLANMKQNVTMGVTVAVLSLLTVFSCVMLQNFVIQPDSFVGIVAGEQASVLFGVDASVDAQFHAQMKADDRVEKIYLYTTVPVNHGDDSLAAYVLDDAGLLNNPEMCYAGRLPMFANETAIGGKYAKEQGLKVGETVTLSKGDRSGEYLICGLFQTTNYFGKDVMLLRGGYTQLAELDTCEYYIDLQDGISSADFLSEASVRYGEHVRATANIEEIVSGSLGIYQNLVVIIVAAILLMTLIIVLFVLYLMVKTLLLRKRKDYGIMKAIGFTTKQLILQTAVGFMPAVVIATLVGCVLGCILMNPLLTVFFSSIGVMKCTFTIPVLFVAGAGSGTLIFAFAFACLLSLRIRAIAPCALLKNE